MQVTVDQTSSIECNISIVLPADYTQASVDKRLKDIAKNAKIDGFRKGKIPMSIVQSRFEDSAYFDAVNDAVNDSYRQAITDNNLPVLSAPRIENLKADKGQEISFNAIIEVYPDVKIGDLSGLEIEKIEAEVTDDDIDTMIEQLRQQQKEYEQVERAATNGDKVNASFNGRANGEEIEGGSAEKQDIELGSKSMIPGFEEGVIGMSAGETKTINVKFPDDYQAEHLRGADAEFDITVNSVSEIHVPDVDQEFMKKFDVDSGMDDFRAKIKSNMEKNLNEAIKAKLQMAVTDALVEAHSDVLVPQTLLKEQVDSDKRKMFQQFSGSADMDVDLFPDEPFIDKAEKTVVAALLMRSVMEIESITADKDLIKSYIEAEAAGFEDPQEVVNFYYSNEQALNQIEGKVLEEQIVDVITGKMNVNTVKYSYTDAMSQQQPGSEDSVD